MNNDVPHYTADPYGHIAVPNLRAGFLAGYVDKLPVVLGEAKVREMARELADALISEARDNPGPVVWVTGNAYMPPLRFFTAAEQVWNAANNDDGELFAFFVELVEDHLSREQVIMESPEYDNSLYVVDLKRWQYCEDAEEDVDDINGYWEPVDPDATDDNHDNPRE